MTTVGTELYPLPGLVIVMPLTMPVLLTVAVAVAPFPPPPEIVTDGGVATL